MIVAIADTHPVIWYLFSDPRLGANASAFIDQTAAKGDHIGISAITLAEMVYLIEKGKIPPHSLKNLHTAMAASDSVLRHIPFDQKIATKMAEVSREEIPELPDRIIATTAYVYGVPVLTRDTEIQNSKMVQSIW
jgi:PIN domain nuclease of toxin-antitoxin system